MTCTLSKLSLLIAFLAYSMHLSLSISKFEVTFDEKAVSPVIILFLDTALIIITSNNSRNDLNGSMEK